MAKMNIVYKQLDELIPYEANAKTHPETQLANIAASLERYGWKQPVVIDREGVIICGHGRVQAAQHQDQAALARACPAEHAEAAARRDGE